MRSMILAVAAAASLAVASFGAEAMPATTVAGAAPAAAVTLVSGRCGAFAHRNGAGFCVPNRAAYYRPYYYRPYAHCGIRVGPIGIGGPC